MRGNKRRAEEMLQKKLKEYEDSSSYLDASQILFADYVESWLARKKNQVQLSTWESYNEASTLNFGKFKEREFASGCVSMTGTATLLKDNTVPDKDTPNSYAVGTEMSFTISKGDLYFTENLTTYQQRSVEWDLLDWGQDTIRKLSQPFYTFSVDSANFIALDEFISFKSALTLGNKCYLNIDDGKVLQPIVIGVEVSFDDISAMSITFSDKYNSSDSAFQLVDLLDKSISMGKTVDYNKYSYNAFVESGAANQVSDFFQNALDVAKQNILSATGQAISWDENGMKFRKWNEDHTGYDPRQMWAINNQLVFTNDGFNSVNTAIGEIKVGDSTMYGISTQALLGEFLAGSNLSIRSEKKDALGNSVFQVDGSGAQLHNATFDIFSGSNKHITLNPDVGFAMGDYPVYNQDGTINMDKAKIYFDIKTGDAVFKGRVEADSGSFQGTVTATDFFFKNGDSVKTLLGGKDALTQIPNDLLNLYGLTIYQSGHLNQPGYETFQIKSNGDVSLKGNITMQGGSINWNSVGHDPLASEAKSIAQQIADGSYSGGTFINGQEIYSPTIYVGELGTVIGSLGFGSGSAGGTTTDAISMASSKGLLLKAAGGGLGLESSTSIYAKSDFNVIGGDAYISYPRHLYISNGSKWLDIRAEIESIKNRITALEP